MHKHKIDLLLVNPNNRKQSFTGLNALLPAIEPPLWTALIAGFIRRQGFSVKIIDAEAQGQSPQSTAAQIIKYDPLLVGVSLIGANPSASSTPKMLAASQLLNNLKNKSLRAKTFLYGIHPSALPERTLKEEAVDFVLRGECFYTVLKLLKILKSAKKITRYKIPGLCYWDKGKAVISGWGKLVNHLDLLPMAAWDLLPMDKYRAHNWHCLGFLNQRQPYAVIYTSLGCPFCCQYCNIRALYNGKPGIRFRSPQKVAEELDFLVKHYKVKNIKIIDEIFVLRKDYVFKLCDLIIARGYHLNIWAYARIDTVDSELLKKMKQAGINWLCYGIESADQQVRKGVAKVGFGKEQVKKVIRMTHAAGINIIGNFMFGLPGDNFKTMQSTLSLAKELSLEYANFYVTMAYPGSPLYAEALEKGVPLPGDWGGYSQLSRNTLPLATRYLSGAQVLAFRDNAFVQYYTDPEYLELIAAKFGPDTRRHIQQMLKHKIPRKLTK